MTVRDVRRILIEELARGTPPAASRIADAAPAPVRRILLLHLAQVCPQCYTPVSTTAADHVAELKR
jgi:hypothetical protein